MDIHELLGISVRRGASDIHIIPGRPPFLRINGEMEALDADALSGEETRELIFSSLSAPLIETFEREKELDTGISAPGIGRFRMNVLEQIDGVGAVLRVIPAEIPSPQEIGLTSTVINLIKVPRGMILVTGPTGSGKSTTLASLINVINEHCRQHILTVEDPIEYVYPKRHCVVTQREIGTNSRDFRHSLKHALRQDPDIVLIGELRDLETISAALTIAETGHLVFATLHTTDAAQTVDRIVDVFPPYQQQQVRTQLGATLKAVICQQLIPLADGVGRVAAREIMIVTTAIANIIREGKTHQLYNAIEAGAAHGMRSLDKDLAELCRKKTISFEMAVAKANNPSAVRGFTQRMGQER